MEEINTDTFFLQAFVRDWRLLSISILNRHNIIKKSSVGASRDYCNPVTAMCTSESRKTNEIFYKKACNSGPTHSLILQCLYLQFAILQCINNSRQNNKHKINSIINNSIHHMGKNSGLCIPKYTFLHSRKAWRMYLSLDHQAQNKCNNNLRQT